MLNFFSNHLINGNIDQTMCILMMIKAGYIKFVNMLGYDHISGHDIVKMLISQLQKHGEQRIG